MSRQLWRVSVSTTPEAEEAVAELLGSEFKQTAVSYTSTRTLKTFVAVYLRKKPAWGPSEQLVFNRQLQDIARHLPAGSLKISCRSILQQDWAHCWKRHFKPIEIGTGLLIRPTWSRRRPAKGQALVEIDPGLSFGTGQHPTTAFCLRKLVALRNKQAHQSFLDIGTGSGILAIAAAKLGYSSIDAFDFDPDAVTVARANARANHVSSAINFQRQDLAKLPMTNAPKYDVVCANLIANLLLSHQKRLLVRLKPGGILVLAGILSKEFSAVQKAYEQAGLTMTSARTEKEWRSGAFGILKNPRNEG